MSSANSNTNFSAQLDRAIAGARTRVLLGTVLSVASVALAGFYLNDAHRQFGSITPALVSNYVASQVLENLPAAAPELKSRLIACVPDALDAVEGKISQLPDHFATQLHNHATTEMERAMPELEKELTGSLQTALRNARDSRVVGNGDEAGIKAFINSLADTYAEKSGSLIDEMHAKYEETGGDALAYLEFLAEGKGLDERQALQRKALQSILTTAARTQKATQGAALDAN